MNLSRLARQLGNRLECVMCEKVDERRRRRLKAILGDDISKMPEGQSVRMPDAAKDDPVHAILIRPDGSVERLRMSRGGKNK